MVDPELLLPVGNMPMALAAIHGGATAIYVGVPGFNARGRTYDFSLAELKELIDLCHLYGVKVNLAFNVLIFEEELALAHELLQQIIPLAPDAFIVQDLGLARMIRSMTKDIRIHASTQMTVTNQDAIYLLKDLEIDRFVLGRENSLPEIKLIKEHTNVELEVFVHGALCVAYSGQCFTSESLGGRSANRGQCAQSCRLSYEMYVDGEKRDLGDKKYLVSPKDLCGLDEVAALKDAGVASFKVEGRLKSPDYVYTAAKSYQLALQGHAPSEREREKLAISYSRGFFSGWLHGVNHQALVEGTYSSHRGLELGLILEVRGKKVIIQTPQLLKAGQGVVFETREGEKGAKIFALKTTKTSVELELHEFKDFSLLQAGQRVWLNSDESITQETKRAVTSREHMRRIPLTLELKVQPGEPLRLVITDPEARQITLLGAQVSQSETQGFHRKIVEELSALSHTPFLIDCVAIEGEGGYVNLKEVKRLKNQLITELSALRVQKVVAFKPYEFSVKARGLDVKPRLNILLREKAQVDELLGFKLEPHKLSYVILDFEFGKDYHASVKDLKAAGFQVALATTRILKPMEYYNLNTLVRLEPDAILVRNLGALHYLQGKNLKLLGDFSLNASNSMTVEYLLSKNLESVCLSYDLNQAQLESMLKNVETSKVEVCLHQYMPEFHMEHCVFAAFMSKGTSFKDCGKPCEKHSVELKDSYGNMHFLKADQECRNTMYRGSAQSAGFLVPKHSLGFWRFEALHERGETLRTKIQSYLNLLDGTQDYHTVASLIGSQEKYGVTEGQLTATASWRDRKKSQDISF
jgi:putative protease